MNLRKKYDVGKLNSIKNVECVILSFFIPFVIMALVYYRMGIYPGGYYTALTMDMGAEYMPLWASLRYLGNTDSSLFVNMSGALGNGFFGYACYGVFSPLTWITVLFSLEQLPDVIFFLTLLRIGLAGVSFCCFIGYIDSEKKHHLSRVLLSCCYALMAYNIGYSVNLMWLDAVILLPWILIGIERILMEGKPLVFILSVFFSLVINYYLSFMSAVFAAGYLLIRLTEQKKLNIKFFSQYVLYVLVGAGMSSPIVIPAVMALEYGKLSEGADPMTSLFRHNLLEVMGQLLAGRYDTLIDDGLPFIFCGTGTIILVVLYFIMCSDKWRLKISWLAFISFYFFSLCFIPLDRVLHGFKETIYYEGRYSYSFSCLLLILAYRGIVCSETFLERFSDKRPLKIALTCFVLLELYLNASVIISGIMAETHYETLSEYNEKLLAKRELLNDIGDGEFYRVSDYSPYTYNDGSWLGYNGIGYFSSCYNINVMEFLGGLGEDQSHHVLRDGVRTPLEESLLGVRYRIADAEFADMYEKKAVNCLYSISENKFALALGYMAGIENDQHVLQFTKNAFENQNVVARELSKIDEEVFVELEQHITDNRFAGDYVKKNAFSVTIPKSGSAWLYAEKADQIVGYNDKKNTELIVNGYDFGEFIDPGTNSPFIRYLGDFKAGEQIDIELFGNTEYGRIHVDYMDEDVYKRVLDKLGSRQLDISEHGGGHFHGSIDAGEGGNMILTLPAVEGWKIKIDGNPVSANSYRDVFMVVPLPYGKHEIDIRYVSPGIYLGSVLGTLSLAMLFLMLFYKKNEKTIGI